MTIKRIKIGIIPRLRKILPEKTYLRLLFWAYMDQKLDLENPKTFNAKLQWLKLYNRKPEFTQLVDKIEVKKWVEQKIGKEYVIPTYGVWEKPEDIRLEELPDSFVMKCNHFGGNCGIFLVPQKSQFDIRKAKNILTRILRSSVYDKFKEWPYKNVDRRILAEQFLGEGIEDYKFFCYDGFAESVMVAYERNTGHPKFYFFDRNWNLKRYNVRGKEAPEGFTMPKPENVDKMFEIAETLSKGLPFVRVDLYNINGKIYFGEMTFFPASGLDYKILPEIDEYFGSLLQLPKEKRHE